MYRLNNIKIGNIKKLLGPIQTIQLERKFHVTNKDYIILYKFN
jgi:hypothetical protein